MPHRGVIRAVVVLGTLALPLQVALADPIDILFVGNSFTHGKYLPVRTFNAGFGTGAGNVHDDNCLSSATCSSAEAVVSPAPTTGTNEYGPFGGIPGIFLELTQEAGLNYDVSINAVSSATLTGTANSASRVAAIDINPLTGRPFDTVVLQEQSFSPLPSVNNLGNATRGNFASFVSGTNRLVSGITAADAVAGQKPASIYLYETQPLASYTYASPLVQGSSVSQPYVGDPIETIASDLHDAYTADADQNAAITGVAYAGDAWINAIESGVAVRNPFLSTNPANQVDLWDSDVNAACCTTPIGYHPSTAGAYLNALVLFDRITGVDPTSFGTGETAAAALGITPGLSLELEQIAAQTVTAGGVQSVPEPASALLLLPAMAFMLVLRRSRRP